MRRRGVDKDEEWTERDRDRDNTQWWREML
jgi:hypothetical protein